MGDQNNLITFMMNDDELTTFKPLNFEPVMMNDDDDYVLVTGS